MERYITDTKSIRFEDLNNLDWDLIELNFTVDHMALKAWADSVMENMQESKFVVSQEYMEKYFEKTMIPRFRLVDPHIIGSGGPVYWWLLNWSIERYDPLPFYFLANREIFPEVRDPSFDNRYNPILSKYKFGGFADLCSKYESYLLDTRLIVLPANSGLKLHVDNSLENQCIRLHMQVDMNTNCKWHFGYAAEREYLMEPGKVYLANTSVPHAVINTGTSNWLTVYGTPRTSQINELLDIQN